MIPSIDVDGRVAARELKRMGRALDSHRKGELNRAVSRVLNRNLATIKNRVVRGAASAMQLKQKTLRPRVAIRRSTPARLSGKVWVGLNPITAQAAGAKPADEGYAYGPYHWPNAFSNAKLHGGIFERKGRARLPIKKAVFGEQFVGPTLRRVTDTAARENLDNDFRLRLFKELDHRWSKILS